MMNRFRLFAFCSILIASPALAGDWPQILGPNRNGVAEDESIVDRLTSPPKLLWKRSVGEGYAGVAVQGGMAFLFHRIENQERIEAIDLATQDVRWKSDSPTSYSGAVASDDGPRCVPTVTEDSVIVFGAQGRLRCLDLRNGKEIWSNPTHETFNAQEGYFGAGSSPVVEQDLVLVNVGAPRTDAGIVAFDSKTGEVRWKATDEQPSYSSPIVSTVDDERRAIFVTRLNCVGIEPSTGKVLWSFPFGARGPTVNAAAPVLLGNDHLFLTASYGVGALSAKLSKHDAQELWRDRKLMASQYTTPIAHEGVLYGIDGRQDVGPVTLRCFDPQTKEILWDEADFGYATLMMADEKLLAQRTDGTLVLIAPDKNAYSELGRASLSSGTVRALPALSNGRYLIRDEHTLYCYSLAP